MISFFSKWIEQITISVIVVSIFELVLPNGNIKKYIKVVLGIYVIFCIISPFVDSKALYNIENYKVDKLINSIEENSQSQINNSNIDSRLETLYIKEIKEDINKRIKEYGCEVYKCEIEADFKSVKESAGIHKIKLIIEESKIEKIKSVDININKSNNEVITKENCKNQLEEGITNNKSNNLKDLGREEKIENIKQNLAEQYNIPNEVINIKMK